MMAFLVSEKNKNISCIVVFLCYICDMNNSKFINPKLVSNTDTLRFVPFKSELVDQIDVYHNETRIAILNGLSSPLQFVSENGSNIPIAVVIELEKKVTEWVERTNKEYYEKKEFAKSRRELHLLLPEVGEEMNVFGYAKLLMLSLKYDTITPEEYDMLCGDFQHHCQTNKIATENEICRLF